MPTTVKLRWCSLDNKVAVEFAATNEEEFIKEAIDAAITYRQQSRRVLGTGVYFPSAELEILLNGRWIWPNREFCEAAMHLGAIDRSTRVPSLDPKVSQDTSDSDATVIKEAGAYWWRELADLHARAIKLASVKA